MSTTSRARRALLALGLGLVAGCQSPLATESARPQLARPASSRPAPAVVRQDPQLLPLPATAGRALVEVGSGKLLTGQAALQALTLPFFEDSGAYRLQAMALNRTLVTATSLEEDLYVKGGKAIMGASDASGKFSLVDAPADRAFVLSVQLAASHRLSAIVPVGANSAEVDEGTSMVAEMARWQIRSAKPADGSEADRTTMADLSATTVAALHLKSRDFVFPADLDPGAGPVPSVDALKVGAGHVLRNRYVAAFGSRITSAGDTVADWLSDAWRGILGYRPLALTRVAGNGRRGANQNDGLKAVESSLTGPNDAVAGAGGHVVIAEQDEHLLRYVPASDLPGGYLGYPGPMQAGRIYTIAGVVNGPTSLEDFDGFYQPIEASAAADPAEAPPLAVGFPIFTPYRVALTDAGDMFFTSKFGHRVFYVPASNVTGRYGRDFLAGRLYTLAGHGAARGGDELEDERQDYLYGEGAPGLEANLAEPTGLAVDQAGNVYMLDSGYAENELADAIASDETDATYTFPNPNATGRTILVYHGTIRIVRASDGAIVTLKLTLGGQPFPVTGAQDLQLVEQGGVRTLYVADTNKHWVFKVEVPADLTATPLTAAITPVLGAIDEPGYVKDGVALPDAFHAFDGVPLADARLNGPTSLTFDQAGRLIVADAGTRRVRLLDDGKVYTIAGGFDTRYLEGDARLGYMPQTTSVRLDRDGNLLLVDRKEQLVRKIWTRRGSL
ncbi:MAG: hypothetical protein ACLGIN_01115 [Candidatus Sericytochromatia bacterium]